ncbi:hypothetical protein BC829DRAFT_414742 [Chytridium lagenaria]|nr:hypothetical protein BC829DRAFT_414742 [Chytridium lagenaria]
MQRQPVHWRSTLEHHCPPQFGEIGKWIDPGKVPEMFGADLVKDPFECIGKVLGHARVSEEWKKMRRPVREEDWETVDGGLDTLHVVVVLEKDPGLPPSYEDLKAHPMAHRQVESHLPALTLETPSYPRISSAQALQPCRGKEALQFRLREMSHSHLDGFVVKPGLADKIMRLDRPMAAFGLLEDEYRSL